MYLAAARTEGGKGDIRGLALVVGARRRLEGPGSPPLAMPHVRAAKITFDRFDRRYKIKGNERQRRERRRGCRCGCIRGYILADAEQSGDLWRTCAGVDRFFCFFLFYFFMP